MPPIRIAATSDLHLPITAAEVIRQTAREIGVFRPDTVAVAGDIGESLADIRRCLDIIRAEARCPVLVVPGNHDLWCRDAPSQRLWEERVPEVVREAGCVWLEGDAWVKDGVAVAGTIAWYDYSAVDPSIEESADVFARSKHYFNVDAQLINWRWTDIEFAAKVAKPFLATLDRLEEDPAIREVIVVTHVPLLECQMCRKPDSRDWGFSNAYFGNLTLGDEVLDRKKVTHVISGHTHVERFGVVRAHDGHEVEARVLASDYRRPAWVGLEVGD